MTPPSLFGPMTLIQHYFFLVSSLTGIFATISARICVDPTDVLQGKIHNCAGVSDAVPRHVCGQLHGEHNGEDEVSDEGEEREARVGAAGGP